MARPANIIPGSQLCFLLPADIRARLDLHLWSSSQARIPHGAYARLLTRLVTQYLDDIESKPESPPAFGLAPLIREGSTVCRGCRFPPTECICKAPV